MPDPELLPPPPRKSPQQEGEVELLPPPPPKKKRLGGSASAGDGTEDYSGGSQSNAGNPYLTGDYEIQNPNQPSSTSTNLSRKNEIAEANRTAPSKEELAKENEGFKQQALETTVKRSGRTKEAVKKDIADGKLILSSDGKGNKIYARQPGAGETFVRGLVTAKNSLVDAGVIATIKATGTPEELANYYEQIAHRKQVESEKEFSLTDELKGLPGQQQIGDSSAPTTGLPTAAPTTLGSLTEMGGALAPDIAMAAGTGGLSTAAKTAIIGGKMYTSSYGNKAFELYERGKEEAIRQGMDEKQASILAAHDATNDAVVAAIPDAYVNTLFFSGKLHSPAANNFISVMKGAAKDAVKVGALGARGSLATSLVEKAEGYDIDGFIDKALESGGEFAKMDMLFKVLPILRTLPKAAQSAVKEFAVDPVVKPFVEQQLKTLNQDIATNISNELAAYEAATKDIRGIVPEEKMASLGGRMQKRQNRLNGINILNRDIMELEGKKRNVPETFHEEIDATIKDRQNKIVELEKEVESVDKEIETIKNSKGTGLEKEKDEATGEPIIPKEEPEPVKEPSTVSSETPTPKGNTSNVVEGSVGVGGDKKTNTVNGYEFTKTPTLENVIVEPIDKSNNVIIEKQMFADENKNVLAKGVKYIGGGWYEIGGDNFGSVDLYNTVTKEGVSLNHKQGGRTGVFVQDFIKNNSRYNDNIAVRGSKFTQEEHNPKFGGSGHYKGTYFYVGLSAESKALEHGKNLTKVDIENANLYELVKDGQTSQSLKNEAKKAGYDTRDASGYAESEYLKKQGYDGIKRGNEIILFEPKKFEVKEKIADLPNVSGGTVKQSVPEKGATAAFISKYSDIPLQMARREKYLDSAVMSNGKQTTERKLIEERVKQGWKVTKRTITDDAASKKLNQEYERLKRTAPIGNENHPETKRLRELEKMPKSLYNEREIAVKKEELRLESPEGTTIAITPFGEDYVNELLFKEQSIKETTKAENKPLTSEQDNKAGTESVEPVPTEKTGSTEGEPIKTGSEAKTPEPPIEPPTAEKREGDKFRDKGILNRLYTAEKVPEQSRKGFEEQGLKYEPQTQEEAKKIGESMVDSYGIEDAVTLAEGSRFKGGVNSAIFAESLNRVYEMEQKATTAQEKMKAAALFAEIGQRYDEFARGQGRDISQIGFFYKKSPLGIKLMEEAKRMEEFDVFSKRKDKSWKEFFDEMMKEPEFEKLFKEEVEGKRKEERQADRAKRKEKVHSAIDKAAQKAKDFLKPKNTGGGDKDIQSLGIDADTVINAASALMKKAYDAGDAVAKVIEDGAAYISKKLGHDEWDIAAFKEHYEKVFAEEKKNKTPEELTEDKKQKLLDRFRKKLKGLNESEKDTVIKKAFKQLVENGALEYADFKKIIAETLGYDKLSAEESARLTDLVNKSNMVEDAIKKAQTERTDKALLDVKTAQIEAGRASRELAQMLSTKPSITRRLTSVMQLNTLGIPALVNNPIYNIVNQVGLRLPVSIINSVVDQGLKYGAKAIGKEFKPETDLIAAQAEFFKKLGLGAGESFEQLRTGLNRMDYTQKEIYGQQIRPGTSLVDLYKHVTGQKRLSQRQIVDKAIQGTVGIPAEIVARVLNLGDKPMRFGAEGAQAATFAKSLGLKGIDYKLFIEFPKEEAYRHYKNKGMDDAEAMKKAEYISDTIVKEGERATFQQDNFVNDKLNKLFGGETSGIGSLAKAVTVSPYIKIPTNAFWSYYNLINPEVALLQSLIYGGKALAKEKNPNVKFKGDANQKTSAKYLHESRYWLAHAMVGMGTRAAIATLVNSGIFNPNNDEKDPRKEREGEQSFDQQGTINVSKLNALLSGKDPSKVENGLLVQNRWFGTWGTIGNAMAKKYEGATPEQRENQEEFFNSALGLMEVDALKDLQSGVFNNTSALLGSLDNPNILKSYGINLINMFGNIVQPQMMAQDSKAKLDFYPTIKDDSFFKELKNSMLVRSSTFRWLTDKYPPSKINIWGEPMKKEGDALDRLFNITHENKDDFARPIYEDAKRTADNAFFPPDVKPKIKVGETTHELNTKEWNELQIFVGQQRKQLAAPYFNNMAKFEGENKTYNKLDDEEKKDKLRILYEVGYKNGEQMFLQLHPEFNTTTSKEKKREKKKDSKSNRTFRKKLQSQ